MRRRVWTKIEGGKEEVEGQEEARRRWRGLEESRRRGGGGARCLPERFYCLPMGLTRDEVLQSQIGLRQCVCVCVCVCVSASLREVRLKLRRIADALLHFAYTTSWVLCQNTISHNQGSANMCIS